MVVGTYEWFFSGDIYTALFSMNSTNLDLLSWTPLSDSMMTSRFSKATLTQGLTFSSFFSADGSVFFSGNLYDRAYEPLGFLYAQCFNFKGQPQRPECITLNKLSKEVQA